MGRTRKAWVRMQACWVSFAVSLLESTENLLPLIQEERIPKIIVPKADRSWIKKPVSTAVIAEPTDELLRLALTKFSRAPSQNVDTHTPRYVISIAYCSSCSFKHLVTALQVTRYHG